MLKGILFIVVIVLGQFAFSQDDSVKYVKYYAGFRFNSGIYVNHSQLIENNPVPVKRIITRFNKLGFDFFEKLLSEKSISFYDEYGLKKSVNVNELWGFSKRGAVYINWGDDYSRIPVVGSICHFISTITVYDDNFYSDYGNSFYSVPTSGARTDIYQFLMDFKSGKILAYSVDNVLLLLESDSVLYEEYKSLKKRKKKQMKFLYVREFNEKHTLYIPVN